MSRTVSMVCDCGWTGDSTQLAEARDPFHEGQIVKACPACKQLNGTAQTACDRDGCFGLVVAGVPTPEGYKFLCHVHYRL